MKAARHILLAMAALGLGGCVALNRGSLAPRPRPVGERTLDLDAVRRAITTATPTLIQSLEAKPTIAVKSKVHESPGATDGSAWSGRGTSSSSFRPCGQTKANIGSNDEEFWFWVQSDDDRSIYWCKYDDLESAPWPSPTSRTGSSKPSGLKPITPEEADSIRVQKTDDPKLSALRLSAGQEPRRILSADDDRLELHPAHQGAPHLSLAIASRHDRWPRP